MFGSAKKGIKHWIFNRFLLVNSEMWIRTAIKLPHDLGVCQKTVTLGNSAGDSERKTPTSWIRTAIKSPLPLPLYMVKITYVPLRNNYRPNRALHYTAVKIVCGSIFRFILAINTQCAVIDMQIILNDILHDLWIHMTVSSGPKSVFFFRRDP